MTDTNQIIENPSRSRRLTHVDVLRGAALLAMASYHFSWDLEFFGYLDAGTANTGLMKIYARCIASTFLILAGMSLFWAHERGFRRRSFFIRLAKVGSAALLITVATYFATPGAFIFFGILHEIAVASLLGLIFLRAPIALTFAASVFFVFAPFYLRESFFDQPWLLWVGLSEHVPLSNDYVPLFPWFGAVLGGVGIARLISNLELKRFLGSSDQLKNPVYRSFLFAGRHSLAIYLLHQPILIAFLWTFAQVMPAAVDDPVVTYINDCQAACSAKQSQALCERFCSCTLDQLMEQNLFETFQLGATDGLYDKRIKGIAEQCTLQSQ